MNLRRVAKALGATAAVAVLVISGLYVLVYLQRWEWNRALVSGLLFLSTLMLGSTVLVLRRLAALGSGSGHGTAAPSDGPARRTSGTVDAVGVDPTVADALRRSSADAAARHFDWLRPDDGRLGVFVPILLGTGAILSAVAYVIERVAGLVAGATLDRRTASVLPLHLPLGDGRRPVVALAGAPSSAPPPGRVGRLRTIVAVVALVAVLGAGVEMLRRVTQSEASGVTLPGRTTMTVEVRTKRSESAAAAFAALWSECARRVDGAPRLVDTAETPLPVSGAVVAASRFTIEIDSAFTAIGRQRIIGCLSDLTADLVAATVDPTSVTEQLSTGSSPQDLPSARHSATTVGDGV